MTEPPVRWALYKQLDPPNALLTLFYMCIVAGDRDEHAVLMEPSDGSEILALPRSNWANSGFERVHVGLHPNDAGMLAALKERGIVNRRA